MTLERHAPTPIVGLPRKPLTAAGDQRTFAPKVSNERFTDVIAHGPEPQPARLRAYTFEVVEGPDRGRSVKSDRGSLVVGTSPDADLVLTDSAVSRSHVRLVPFADGVEVTDLGSKNGTFLAGTRLMQARVAPGSEFTIGRSTIRIVPEDADQLLEPSELTQFGPLRGRSRAMRQLFTVLELAAKSESPVLIEGERGVGKMRTARSIHERSTRAKLPIVVLDAGALDGERWTDELTLSPGTAVLRDVDRLSPSAQAALLRVLETKRLTARLVTTTQKNLRPLASGGLFDRDLLLRLAIVHVKVPPLRERASDLPLLIEDIIKDLGQPAFELGPADLGRMQAYAWPDNIAELKTVIQRAVSFEGASLAEPREDSPKPAKDAVVGADLPYKEARAQMIEAFEREYVRGLLERHEGNVSKAARAAGIDRVYLHRLLRKYDL